MIITRRNMFNAEPLWYWMRERHAIYCRRWEGKKWPWTKDPILQRYRFCNVFRELDTVTKWIHDNWRVPYADHKNLWFAMCVARQINLPETLKAIGFPKTWDPKRIKSILNQRVKDGHKIYTGAYIITAGGQPGSKINYTVDKVLTPLYESERAHKFFAGHDLEMDLKEAHEFLMEYMGFGRFIAYEVVTDLRHTRYLRSAPDIHLWANAGPGAKRGLNRIWGRDVHQSVRPEQLTQEMRTLLDLSKSAFKKGEMPPLEMRDIEHSLCEMDKYLRVKNGEGRPRATYTPKVKS